jgi:hypothetical protein
MGRSTMKHAVKKNRAPAPGDEFLTTEKAAKRLKRSAKTLEYRRTAGLGRPFYRQQRGVPYLSSEVMVWEPALALIPRTPETEALRLMRDNDSRPLGFLAPGSRRSSSAT